MDHAVTRQPPRQNPPPVQRLRVRYAKRGRLRFTSHRDFSRAFERAVVRARLPMAYSSGFNPHPRISYAGASPTGAASEAEYLEIALAEAVSADDVREALAQTMPDGLDVLAVTEADGPALADLLVASRWRIEVGAPAETLRPAVEAFLAAEEVPVSRMTKKGVREFDCRGPVLRLDVRESPGERACLDLVVRHVEPAVRPDDVLGGVVEIGALGSLGTPLLTRLAQGPLDEETGEVGDPLADSPAD